MVILPNFTLIGLGSSIDPLRIANGVAGGKLYDWCTIALTDAPVPASDGVRVTPDYTLATAPTVDAVLIIGPNPIPTKGTDGFIRWLKATDRDGIPIGGVDTGSYFVARAGLMDGYRCTIHWEDMEALVDQFPRLVVSKNLFEVDRDRCSCSGGIAALDMMIYLIGLGHGGRELAAAVSELLICERRGPEEQQRIPLKTLVGPMHPKLAEALILMESNLEEPLSVAEIATHVNLSTRHLERLFHECVHCRPSQFYLRLRLEKARQLLLKTERPIADIAGACGFVSLAHFTSRYGAEFGVTPRVTRRRRATDAVSEAE
jgi:AraC family transcriptional regulator, glycine betaine-responsive activator